MHGFAILKNTALVYCIKRDSKNYPTILDASVVKYDTGLVQKARLVYNYLYVRRSLILCHMSFLYACETHVNLRLLNSGKLYRWTYFTIYLQSFLLNKTNCRFTGWKTEKGSVSTPFFLRIVGILLSLIISNKPFLIWMIIIQLWKIFNHKRATNFRSIFKTVTGWITEKERVSFRAPVAVLKKGVQNVLNYEL